MENIAIRRSTSSEVECAIKLAFEVFMEFQAPDYHYSGVESFKRDIVQKALNFWKKQNKEYSQFTVSNEDKLVALIDMRSNKKHINLAFTKKEYQRKGIARVIFNYLLNDVLEENPLLESLTLNSSPYGIPFYLSLDFIPLSEEQEIDGMRFTPMKHTIKG